MNRITNQLRNQKSTTSTIRKSLPKRTGDFLVAMTILIGLSSLPFLNELITQENGALANWLVSEKTQESLLDENGRIFGYTKFRVFLFYFLIQLYAFIASLGWFAVAKKKPYRLAILLCSLSSLYHIFLILSVNRKTFLNDFDLKLWGTIGFALVLITIYTIQEFRKRKKLKPVYTALGSSPGKIISLKVVLAWLGFILISTFPYYHDIITMRGTGLKDWVPVLGIEEFLTRGERDVWGFSTYRVFILTLFVQLFAQAVWAGWFMDAKYSLYKPFLLVPVGLSLYQITMIVMVSTDTYLNKPDFKFVLVLALGILVGLIYYFKNDALPREQESITNVVPQNNQYKNT